MKVSPIPAILLALGLLSLSACEHSGGHEEAHEEHSHKVLVTRPIIEDVTSTQPYVCQIHSCKHIEVKPLEEGYLLEIPVTEGQAVKQGDLLFKINPVLFQAKLDMKKAEANLAEIKYLNAETLFKKNVISQQEVLQLKAELNRANAEVNLAVAEMNFTEIRAAFNGIIDRFHCQQGSYIKEEDVLTTLSDNTLMWVYFNMPEVGYIDYKEHPNADLKIELLLANSHKFSMEGKIGAIESDFNNTTGNIAFRADFPNPDSLLRNGQTGTILISRTLKDALVIPQRSKFETLAKTYVYVVGDDNIVHQREIVYEKNVLLDDIYVIKSGLEPTDKIILEGARQVKDGQHVEYEEVPPEEVLGSLKYRAE